jgi:hypothetical protein
VGLQMWATSTWPEKFWSSPTCSTSTLTGVYRDNGYLFVYQSFGTLNLGFNLITELFFRHLSVFKKLLPFGIGPVLIMVQDQPRQKSLRDPMSTNKSWAW